MIMLSDNITPSFPFSAVVSLKHARLCTRLYTVLNVGQPQYTKGFTSLKFSATSFWFCKNTNLSLLTRRRLRKAAFTRLLPPLRALRITANTWPPSFFFSNLGNGFLCMFITRLESLYFSLALCTNFSADRIFALFISAFVSARALAIDCARSAAACKFRSLRFNTVSAILRFSPGRRGFKIVLPYSTGSAFSAMAIRQTPKRLREGMTNQT
mmetsp:Transcript_36610/g.97642  ORF Transcript_36610/g.97642 Transcript_36610/m.97642 type:complete len:212 (+) Transcript_36610:307-942(+)